MYVSTIKTAVILNLLMKWFLNAFQAWTSIVDNIVYSTEDSNFKEVQLPCKIVFECLSTAIKCIEMESSPTETNTQ